jgi:CheY-like chemotaxis protein
MTAESRVSPPRPDRALTVLLVEDNDSNRDMLSRRLHKRGYRVLLAASGLQALALAKTECPEIILMDLRLPDISGRDVARRLKIDPMTSAIPIIAISAHAQDTDRAAALACGCDDYEAKPVDLARLLEKMQRVLAHRT